MSHSLQFDLGQHGLVDLMEEPEPEFDLGPHGKVKLFDKTRRKKPATPNRPKADNIPQEYARGFPGYVGEDPKNFMLGAMIEPFAFAPDIIGMGFKAGNKMRQMTDPGAKPPFPENFSGDPIREAVGMDLDSPQGQLGAFADPMMWGAGAVKGAAALATTKNAMRTGEHASTTAGRIRNKTDSQGGYTVQMDTGEIPQEGILMGKYANDSGKNLVLPPGEKLTKPVLDKWVGANATALSRVENHLGTWKEEATGKLYVDLSTLFAPDEIRKATKFGERTGQIAGFNIGTFDEIPVGNWDEFIKSPQFNERMMEMQKVGQDYLAKHPTGEWWDIHGTLLEEVYGKENLESIAGYIAATAPNTNPTQNMRMASEYMRRHLLGEDIMQPNWRVPAGAENRTEGVQIGMEAGRGHNLMAAQRGDIDVMRADKVRSEAQALSGDPDAAVFDRWWARIAEDAKQGVYTSTQEGAFEKAKATYNQYEELYQVVKQAAESQGRSVRDFSADVWTGIREHVKATDDLFGAKYKGSALTGESKGYADIFSDLIKSKSEFLGITVGKFKERLAAGDAELLSLIIGAPLGAYAYSQLTASSGEIGHMPETARYPGIASAPGQGTL